MKVLVMVKATEDSETGRITEETLAMMKEMEAYNDDLRKAGILLMAEGLKPSSAGARVHFDGASRGVSNGPFGETRELVAGFWLWEVNNLQTAIDWVRRCPNPMAGPSDIEIRPLAGPEDLELSDPGHAAILRMTDPG